MDEIRHITFDKVMPQVFAHNGDVSSQVWGGTLVMEKGKRYLIEAESGKGKSTFCSYVMGYRHDYSGTIMFNDTDIRLFNAGKWTAVRRAHVACLFQDLRLFPELSALDNVVIKNQLTRHCTKEQIAGWFEQLGIADKKDAPVGQMSFGQQQRVALIRALCQPFDILLADEPISHLDDVNARQMAHVITQACDNCGAALVVTSIGKQLPVDYHQIITL